MVVGNALGEYELSWDEEDSCRAAGLLRGGGEATEGPATAALVGRGRRVW